MRFNRIAILRNQKSLTQAELAELFGVAQSTIQSWECGTRNPPLDRLISLADYFNVSLDYLMDRTDSPAIIVDTKKDPSLTERAQTIAAAAAALEDQPTVSLSAEDRRWLAEYIDTAVDRALDKRALPSDDPAESPGQTGP